VPSSQKPVANKKESGAKPKKKRARKAKKIHDETLPTREQILAFVADAPTLVGKREIGKAFGISGAQRIGLKRLLKEMAEEGLLKKSERKTLKKTGLMPPVAVISIVRRDRDGELLCTPVNWDEDIDPPLIVLVPAGDKDRERGAPVGVGDRVLARITKTSAEGPADYPFEASVIRRIGKGADTILGIFRKSETGGRIIPVDKKNRNEFEVTRPNIGDAVDGDLVLAETMSGPRYAPRRAKVQETYGKGDEQKSISLIAIHAHGIPDQFPENVTMEADRAKPVRMSKAREDLRDIPLITIDPPDARDHDDAVAAHADDDPKNEGGWVVYVAIADVAHYIKSGSALDKEALKRGNSTYFPDRVVPMLPERISNDLCSLREGVDRPCLAVRMVFDRNGNKKSHRFIRGLMKSAARLSYADAQAAFEGNPDPRITHLQKSVIEPMWAAYMAMAKARDKRNPLALDLPEHKIIINKKTGQIEDIRIADKFESMRVIEECMIQANVCAAESLEAKRSPLIYRVHDTPSREKLMALGEFLATIDIKLTKGAVMQPEHFNRILERVHGGEHSQMVSDIVLRSQSQAIYSPDNLGHFGLNLRRYAHFTSPIRRYADLVVHRALVSALDLGDDGLSKDDVKHIGQTAEHISQTERRSMVAERDSNDRYIASYLEKQVGAEFAGRISGVTRFGLFIRLSETGADGLVPISSLNNDFYQHDEEAHALIGDGTGIRFRIGDPVRVRLEEAVPVTGGMRFDIIEGGTKVKGARKGKGSGGPSRGRGGFKRKGGKPHSRGKK
jgi:ribonuclease R